MATIGENEKKMMTRKNDKLISMPDVTPQKPQQDPNDDMPAVYTGNGIDRDLAATTNDRLKKTVQELRRLGSLIGEMIEQERATTEAGKKTKVSLDRLTETIKSLDAKNGKLQLFIAALTVATVALAIIQVWVAMHPTQQPPPQVIIKEMPQSKK